MAPRLLLHLALSLQLALLFRVATSEPTQDKEALLAFIGQTPHESRVQWNPSTSACDWTGVTCDPNRTAVVELRLPAVGLVGPIPPNTLSRLSSLRVLSLHSNRLSGQIPSEFSNLSLLYSLYLQDNGFSGGFPTNLTRLTRLTRLDMAGNKLTGEIPFALNNLTRLTRLFLQNNEFSGILPSINISSLDSFNVSFNSLNGSIPETLYGFPESSFAGNLALCGGPLPPCNPFFPSPAPSPAAINETPVKKSKKKLSTAAIVAISVAAGGILVILLLLLLICCVFRRRRGKAPKGTGAGGGASTAVASRSEETGMTSDSKDEMSSGMAREGERNRLVFVGKGGGFSFDLEDLLRASAEVLGKGSVGTSYKAVLEEGTTVVVKRLKDVVASKREFELQMEEIGKVEHDNLLPLRAYYYSKDEKLLVFDYLAAGSLSSLLHGNALPLLFKYI